MNSYPEIFLIGAMKSGTTTLSSHLSNHRFIYLCPNKEPGYFSRDERYAKGGVAYLEQFTDAQENQLKLDASTCYSRWPYFDKTIKRIFSDAPDAKFIYIMRDPVHRTYSHYKHRMREAILNNREVISFDEAIRTDSEMMCASDYALQISKYLETFSKERFYFTTLDLLIENPEKVMNEIYSFLNLNPQDQIDSVKSMHKNKLAESFKHGRTTQKVNGYMNIQLIQKLKFLVPVAFRKNIRAATYSILKLFQNSVVAEKEFSKVSTLTKEQIEYLRDYFNASVIATEKMTGLDLSSWQEN